ncbi:MAG: ribulose-phosphate 3-epimerase [Nitrososphaerales archaeon]
MVKIAPSIAAGDHGRLAAEAVKVEQAGADWIHVDIMDGKFAPNFTFGPGMVKALRKAVKIPLDCHLMLEAPDKYVNRFLEAGADYVTVHAEAVNARTLDAIESAVKESGSKLGVAFKPDTRLSSLNLKEREISLITVMTVNPGFSGQKFIMKVLPKISEASSMFSSRGIEVEVDGGVDLGNAKLVYESGGTVLVAGNSVFGAKDPEIAIRELKKAVGRAV